MGDDTYNGWANRETWAFNLHWQNDYAIYHEVLEYARDLGERLADGLPPDYELGQCVAEYLYDSLAEYAENAGSPEQVWGVALMLQDIGSRWRIDYAETGAAVREALEAEDS